MKRIVLCADDYGQAATISQAIIELINKGLLTATSCMVNQTQWMEAAAWLKPFQQQVDIGLHFNLTQGEALSRSYQQSYGRQLMPLTTLMRRSFLRQLKQSVIEDELMAQLEQFHAGMGILPHYIDGHQHVHQFPIVRDALIAVYQRELKNINSYVRLVQQHWRILEFKKAIIHFTGVPAFRRLLMAQQIPHNTSFSGVYSFAKASYYRKFFIQFLQEIEQGGMIMCHPGLLNTHTEDAICEARWAEYQYFSSPQFVEDCAQYAVQPTVFRELLLPA